ncbi:hypothetical protein [Nocardioides sp. B-3]|uniref:hypothetical protein n=1 Tax=Nocardioides sp. B-3 TaxID=2895565 RepID=UPI002152080D|nr:hypothetical protein [Nocardioides sp. B-3]UUZ59181.1 hypothetical protein LP418_25200 [Nocardioides sp. B-3]
MKAGSAQQGNGPVNVVVDPPAASVTITHPSGKDISHYTVTLVPTPTPTPTPSLSATPTPTVAPTKVASATPSSTQTPSPTTTATAASSQSPTATRTPTATPTVLGVRAEDDGPELDTSTASDDDNADGEESPEVEVKGVRATAGHVKVPTMIDAGR